jgi:hypothetical protein
MATIFTDEAMQCIDEHMWERTERLARKANHLEASPDTIHPGTWIVRNSRVLHRIELVDQEGRCTCQHFRLWDRCKHAAIVAVRHDICG